MPALTVQTITEELEKIAPLSYQTEYDNAGIQVGDPQTAVTGILITLDITEQVLHEAVQHGCNLIIAHHPLIFRPLSQITPSHAVTRAIIYAIQHHLTLYATHTNFDHVVQGTNQMLGQKLGLCDLRILAPLGNDPHVGAGMIGTLPTPLSPEKFLTHVKKSLGLTALRYTTPPRDTIQHVAICGGSGSSLIPHAARAQVDAFVTADIKYHQFFDAANAFMLVDVGHYESEIGLVDFIHATLSPHFSHLPLRKSSVDTNPVHYHY